MSTVKNMLEELISVYSTASTTALAILEDDFWLIQRKIRNEKHAETPIEELRDFGAVYKQNILKSTLSTICNYSNSTFKKVLILNASNGLLAQMFSENVGICFRTTLVEDAPFLQNQLLRPLQNRGFIPSEHIYSDRPDNLLSFHKEQFDIVVADQLYQYFLPKVGLKKALEEAYRVLAYEGLIVISVPMVISSDKDGHIAPKYNNDRGCGYFSISVAFWENLLSELRFTVRDIIVHPHAGLLIAQKL